MRNLLGSKAAQCLRQACCLLHVQVPSASALSCCLAAPLELRCVLVPIPAQAAAPRCCLPHPYFRSHSHSKDHTACGRHQTQYQQLAGRSTKTAGFPLLARGSSCVPATHPASHFSSWSQALCGLCILLPDRAILIHLTLPDWDCCLELVNCPGTSLQGIIRQLDACMGCMRARFASLTASGHLARLKQQLAVCLSADEHLCYSGFQQCCLTSRASLRCAEDMAMITLASPIGQTPVLCATAVRLTCQRFMAVWQSSYTASTGSVTVADAEALGLACKKHARTIQASPLALPLP